VAISVRRAAACLGLFAAVGCGGVERFHTEGFVGHGDTFVRRETERTVLIARRYWQHELGDSSVVRVDLRSARAETASAAAWNAPESEILDCAESPDSYRDKRLDLYGSEPPRSVRGRVYYGKADSSGTVVAVVSLWTWWEHRGGMMIWDSNFEFGPRFHQFLDVRSHERLGSVVPLGWFWSSPDFCWEPGGTAVFYHDPMFRDVVMIRAPDREDRS
jgi:hypothetical protein